MNEEELVVSGISGRFPESDNIYELWEALVNGVDLTTSDDRRWPVGFMGVPRCCGNLKHPEKFDAQFFGFDDTSANSTEPQLRVFLEVVYEAIIDAGIIPNELNGSNTAIVLGLGKVDTRALIINELAKEKSEVPVYISKTPAIVSQFFGFTGPSFEIDSACASSLSAFVEGIQLVKAGQCEKVIAGGTTLHLSPNMAWVYHDLKLSAPDGTSKSLDASANGYCRSEAVVAVFIQKMKNAKRIYASVKAVEMNNDGFTPEGITFPSYEAQTTVMQRAIKNSKLDPLNVNYIECHIAGTPAGDPVESRSILNAYRNESKKPIMFGCLKSNIGHAEEASGLCGIIKVALIFQKHCIPPNRNYVTPNPNIAALKTGQIIPVLEKKHFDDDTISINSFGFGGANAHAILQANHHVITHDCCEIVDNFPRLVNISGRTEEGLEFATNWIECNRKLVTKEFLSLLNDVSKTPLETGMHCRAFMLFDKEKVLEKRVIKEENRRALWFVFPGIGCQWNGMFKDIASFPIIAKSLHKCAAVLSTVGVDLLQLLNNESVDLEADLITTVVSIISIQISFVDMLYYIGLKPDGIIGHSMGEIAAAYADGCLTLEEAVLTGFYSAKYSMKFQETKYAMADIDLSWEQGLLKCPSGVSPACDNAVDSITVSGPQAAVFDFVEQLKQETVSGKVISSCKMAFHTSLAAGSFEVVASALEKVIRNPKLKSSKMISTSNDLSHIRIDARYFASNYISPVMFRKASTKIAENACVVEVGPSAPLLPLLKRNFPNLVTVALMKKDYPANVRNILTSIGRIYCTGNNVNIEKLYPKVKYPVPRETLSLNHLLKWDHSKSYFVASYSNNINDTKAKVTKNIDIRCEEWKFIEGHCVDGRILFPATGYLYLVWCRYTELMTGKSNISLAVEFKNVTFEHATIISKTDKCLLDISINETTGRFTVVESGSVCVKGYVGFARCMDNYYTSFTGKNTSSLVLKRDEIYKELRIRGYDYGNTFQLLEHVNANGSSGKVQWTENWITFLDCMLQLSIFASKERLLMVPTAVEYVLCDPEIFHKLMKNENYVDIVFEEQVNQIYTHGICIRGLTVIAVQRRTDNQKALLTYQCFSPYFFTIKTRADRLTLVEEYFEKCIILLQKLASKQWDITIENETCCFNDDSNDTYSLYKRLMISLKQRESVEQFLHSLTENEKKSVVFQINYEDMLIVQLKQIMENTKKNLFIFESNDTDLKLEESVVNTVKKYFLNYEYHSSQTDNNDDIPLFLNDINLIIYKDVSTELIIDETLLKNEEKISKLFYSFERTIEEGGFILLTYRTKLTSLEKQIFKLQNVTEPTLVTEEKFINAIPNCFTLVAKRNDDFGVISCIFKKKFKPRIPIFIKPQIYCYEWLEKIKSILKVEKEKVIWLLGKTNDINGVIGLTRCLKKEEHGERFRCCISNEESVPQFVLKNDLIMNYFINECYGVFIHQECSEFKKDVEHAHLDVTTKGDLSSLKWHESFHTNLSSATQERNAKIINVYYSALNFKDVLIASGRIPHHAYPPQWHKQGNLGIEFSGIDENGNQLMGVAKVNSIATTIITRNNDLCWSVPSNWTLEDAATIPVVYITVYYALFTRGKLKQNEKVLIHAGSGGVGQAAIAACLSLNCEVFTSVGTENKKQFLQNKFTQLQEKHFVNTRDANFEEHILKMTNGKGVDVILNSLAEEKFRASINCLAEFGRFLEIGKYDIMQNNLLDNTHFGRNQSFHSICVAHLLDDYMAGNTTQLREIYDLIEKELKSGNIKPLNSTVFNMNEVEKAFRFMATGKHIGKVLIRMRDDKYENFPKPLMVSAIPHTYCNPRKVYILFGGLGGLGLEVAVWLSNRGAKKLVLTSRKGIQNNYQQYIKNKIECNTVAVKIIVNDASTYEKTRNVINEALEMGPIGGVFNIAMVLKDRIITDQTLESFGTVCAPKINTTVYCDQICRNMCLKPDYFVCFSSIASGTGNAGQSNYGYANSVMESICEKRREDGLHGVAIQYGPVGDTGSFNNLVKSNEIEFQGWISQRMPSFLYTLDMCMNSNHAIFSSTILAPKTTYSIDKKSNFLHTICDIIGFDVSKPLDDNISLVNLGVDSLMAVEIKQAFDRECNIVFSTEEIRQFTIKQVKVLSKMQSI